MGTGKKKIEIKKIDVKSRRQVAFSKRRQGLFKKAHEFCRRFGGCCFAAVIFSPAGSIYTSGDMSLVNRFSSAMRMDAAVENVARDALSLLITHSAGIEEVEDCRELMQRKDELKRVTENVSEMLKAVQQRRRHEGG